MWKRSKRSSSHLMGNDTNLKLPNYTLGQLLAGKCRTFVVSKITTPWVTCHVLPQAIDRAYPENRFSGQNLQLQNSWISNGSRRTSGAAATESAAAVAKQVDE